MVQAPPILEHKILERPIWSFHQLHHWSKSGTHKIDVLCGVTQQKKETLHEYINFFTKVIVAVMGTCDGLKCWIFQKGFRSDIMFWENSGFKGARSLSALFSKAQPYIKYEEKLLAEREKEVKKLGSPNLTGHKKEIMDIIEKKENIVPNPSSMLTPKTL